MSNIIHQYSLISALMHGLSTQGTTLSSILSHSDHGLGTVAGLNGELVIINSKAFHFPPDGTAHLLPTSSPMAFPFIMSTTFQPTFTNRLPHLSLHSLPSSLAPLLPAHQNSFLSVRVTAHFSSVTIRIIPAQERPRESLHFLARRQEVKTLGARRGVVFGFWSPAYSAGFSVPGFHLHFVAEDGLSGGHVIGFEAEENEEENKKVVLEAAVVSEYRVVVPEDGEFQEEPIGGVRNEDVKAAEG